MKLVRMVGVFGLVLSLLASMLPMQAVVSAEDTAEGGLVIAQIMPGGMSADQEFVSIYNNSAKDTDITGWCLGNKAGVKFACFATGQSTERLYLKAWSYAVVASDSFAASRPTGFAADVTYAFTGGRLVTSNDKLTLFNDSGVPIDKITWAATDFADDPDANAVRYKGEEGKPTLVAGDVLRRKAIAGSEQQVQDTNSDSDYVAAKDLVVPVSGMYRTDVIVDYCGNIDGVQEGVPDGYMANGPLCEEIDVCSNLEGAQATIPAGYVLEGGACQQDQCANISGLQVVVPKKYSANAFVCTKLPAEKLLVTELLPNPSGDDTASEFIELYNPNDVEISLDSYRLNIGPNFDKQFLLLVGGSIGPKSYLVIQSKLGYFTLVNTTSRVQLADDSGNIIDQTPAYANADDGMAWALVGDTWQYTNQPTPGSANVASTTDEEVSVTTTSLAPCGEGKYRNPLTNRCRSIESDAAVLAACDSGEYRNPETNRCRKVVLAASGLQPCDEGQERNSATNRCRSISASSSSLTPCKEGQERNPSTNRCRNVLAASTAKEPYAVTATGTPANVRIGWIVAGLAAAAAVGYGAYEWRSEIGAFLRKFAPGKK